MPHPSSDPCATFASSSPTLQPSAQAHQVHRHRLGIPVVRARRVLHGEAVDKVLDDTNRFRTRKLALPILKLAVALPTTRRGRHVGVTGSRDVRDERPAPDAVSRSHLLTSRARSESNVAGSSVSSE